MRYQTDEAILVKSSLPASEYRSGFDVAYPLAPMGIFQAQRRSPALTTAALTTALSPAPFGSSTFAPAVSPPSPPSPPPRSLADRCAIAPP